MYKRVYHLSGFTLLELIFSLLLVMIFSTLTISFGYQWYQQNQSATTVDYLLGAIQFSRISAITHGEEVTLCPSQDGISCSTNWNKGYIAITASNIVLRTFEAIPDNAKLIYKGFPSSHHIQFSPTGFTLEQNGTFYYCAPHNELTYSRVIIIEKSGRARIDDSNDKLAEVCGGV